MKTKKANVKKGKPKRSKLSRALGISNSRIKNVFFDNYEHHSSFKSVKVETFLNQVSSELNGIRSSKTQTGLTLDDNSPRLYPEGDFTQAVTFVDVDGKNEKVFYFKEGHVPADHVIFSESKGSARIPENSELLEFPICGGLKPTLLWVEQHSANLGQLSPKPRFVISRVESLTQHLVRVFESLSNKEIGELIFSSENRICTDNSIKSEQEKKLINILFSERNPKRILKRILFGRFPPATFCKTIFIRLTNLINDILHPTLYYTYPDEDHRAAFCKSAPSYS